MSATAARCPHCGAVQSRVQAVAATKPRDGVAPALKDVSSEEARAILALADVRAGVSDNHDDEPGLFAALLLPHPRSAGLAWGAEVALTVIALPLILCSLAGAFLAWRSLRHADRATERGVIPRLVATSSGIGLLSSVSLFTEWSGSAVWSLIAVCCVALLGRAGIRAFVRGRRRAPDLTR